MFLTTAAVLLVVAASGPLVPGVAFTTGTADAAADYRAFGEESTGMGVEKRLAFGAVTLPDGGTLAPTGDGGYRVEFDPVELLVETATTPATVRYAVRIPSLGFGREATERVPARTGRTVRLAAPDGAVPADRVTEGRYGATLAVSVELSDRTLSVAETTVPLEVER
ncbi:MAG: hypothetical protein V5A29_17795 [Haloarculaceae archaeon]